MAVNPPTMFQEKPRASAKSSGNVEIWTLSRLATGAGLSVYAAKASRTG
jgi:hypothetical protein